MLLPEKARGGKLCGMEKKEKMERELCGKDYLGETLPFG